MALLVSSSSVPASLPGSIPRGRSGVGFYVLSHWHLCSLDAPTVAVLWTAFIAHTCGLALPWTALAAMAVAVWILYAADRLLDARLLDDSHTKELEARHHFHHRHRRVFCLGIVAASLLLAPLLLAIPSAAIRLYLVEGALLTGWFALIHILPSSTRLPKELAVGPFFAAAVFIPTVAREPQLRAGLIVPAVLLALVCSLNCLFIYAWEHDATTRQRAHPLTRLALRRLPWLAASAGLASIAAAIAWPHAPLSAACALAIAALLTLHARRHTLDRLTLRAAADVALLTPILLLGLPR